MFSYYYMSSYTKEIILKSSVTKLVDFFPDYNYRKESGYQKNEIWRSILKTPSSLYAQMFATYLMNLWQLSLEVNSLVQHTSDNPHWKLTPLYSKPVTNSLVQQAYDVISKWWYLSQKAKRNILPDNLVSVVCSALKLSPKLLKYCILFNADQLIRVWWQ